MKKQHTRNGLKAYNVSLFINEGSTISTFYVEAHTPNLARDAASILASRQFGRPSNTYRLANISKGKAVVDASQQKIESIPEELF